ncbi:MAG: septal ring lytic transglycosylase RlpA family protein [Fusobacteriaceae bacterium]|nr:septal ring lytic transglycosylase RlpA family protein [Fusobacteriaceae bacterium]
MSYSMDGGPTASGVKFSVKELTAAHKTLKFGTLVKVTNKKNGKFVIVKIIDRGPFTKGRVIDMSPAAFKEIASLNDGVANVTLEVVEKD